MQQIERRWDSCVGYESAVSAPSSTYATAIERPLFQALVKALESPNFKEFTDKVRVCNMLHVLSYGP